MDELKWYGNGADRSLMLQTHPPILVNYATTTSAPPIPFAADRDAPFITKVAFGDRVEEYMVQGGKPTTSEHQAGVTSS